MRANSRARRRRERNPRPSAASAVQIFLRSIVAAVLLLGIPEVRAQAPSWWTTRGVLDTNSAVKDYAPANIGQLKWFATNAAGEIEANLPGGAGSNVINLVSGLAATGNFHAVNLGQLKYVAQPFYDRLIEEGYTNSYPWTSATGDDADFTPANLGQLKKVFDFDVTFDGDSDSLPDWWEIHWFGDTTNAAAGDVDSDGLSNLGEYQQQTDPTDSDSDDDALSDGDEVNVYGTDPLDPDSDNDGLEDGAEVAANTDPLNSDTSTPAIIIIFPTNDYERVWVP